MKKREPVSKIMTTDLVTINHTNSLFDAEKLFNKHKIRHIPVVNNKQIIGILSLTDLLRISFVDNYGEDDSQVDTAVYNMLSIEQVMVKDPVHIAPSLTIKEVAEILGIVTTTDLLNYLLEQY